MHSTPYMHAEWRKYDSLPMLMTGRAHVACTSFWASAESSNTFSTVNHSSSIPQTLKLIDECGCICRHLEYDQYLESHLYLIVQKGVS